MSVDLTHYFGIGLLLSTDPDFDTLEKFEENYPQYSKYSFIRDKSNTKSNIRLIIDGMCGCYAYLLYVIKETNCDDIWSSECSEEFPFNSIDSADVISELQEAYSLLNGGKELRTSDINIISLFHAS